MPEFQRVLGFQIEKVPELHREGQRELGFQRECQVPDRVPESAKVSRESARVC